MTYKVGDWVLLKNFNHIPATANPAVMWTKQHYDLYGWPLQVLSVNKTDETLKLRGHLPSDQDPVTIQAQFDWIHGFAQPSPEYVALTIESEEHGTPTLIQTPPRETKLAAEHGMSYEGVAEPAGAGDETLHRPGAKADNGKPPVGMIFEYFPRALLSVADVAGFGAKKYTRGGWISVPDGAHRYEDALGRHLLKRHIEGPADTESELLHLAHAAWNALAILELYIRENG